MSCLISQECRYPFGKIVDVVKNERVYIDADVSIPFNMDSAIEIDDRKRAGIRFIVNDTRELFTSTPYKIIHKTALNAYFHVHKTHQRLPSFLMTWELFKDVFKSAYSNMGYETYINEPDGINVVDLERDETKHICSCGNPPPYHIDELLNHMMEYSKKTTSTDAVILAPLSSRNNWNFLNPYDQCLKLFYDVTYRNKKYFITYNLIHIYFIDYKAILPKSQHIRASKAIYDPILSLLLTSDMKLYNALKHFLKVGYYYVSISTNDPRTPSGVNDVYTHPMSFSKYIETIPNYDEMITLPKLKMVRRLSETKPIRISPRQDKYDEIQYLNRQRFRQIYRINVRNDFETVIIDPTATRPVRYYNTKIPTIQLTYSHTGIKRPNRIPSLIKQHEPTFKTVTMDVIDIHAGTKKPMPNITADPNISDIPSLKTMLINCYKTNPKFQETADTYENIKIVKGIHFDQCRSIKSRHFNILFFTHTKGGLGAEPRTAGKECTPVYHAYISNNTIVSITAIINMLI